MDILKIIVQFRLSRPLLLFMEHRDVSGEDHHRNMAEAAVENPVARFYCHQCLTQINPVLPEYTCPECQSGFVEEVAQASVEPSEESDNEENEDIDDFSHFTELYHMLHFIRPNDASQNLFGATNSTGQPNASDSREGGGAARYSRPGPSRRNRYARFQGRRPLHEALAPGADSTRSRTELEQLGSRDHLNLFMHHLVNTLSENTGVVTNATFPVIFNKCSDKMLINQLDGTGPPPMPKEKIKEIPTVNISQEQVDKNLQCTVCMEDFIKDEPVRRLACDHHFHNGCITPWLELHGTCPICRKLLNDSSNSHENVFNSGGMDSTSQDLEMSDSEPPVRIRTPTYNPNTVYEFNDEYD
ncbi:hypothetical protein JTE90_025606 [Oedothorax gibbosus]|uniref:RING-type E3 ubiquitin transferase n=1 Tax=Oedothorax gibbosus TaxID=931172 RepID=A0AAV6V8F7_9ARAC|nr:hypothetical protein JTE90_025606 [Oedothorax gibbosus]